ncbi:MAG TPA: copper-binding protein, partial [Vicinamibacterales bacterium]
MTHRPHNMGRLQRRPLQLILASVWCLLATQLLVGAQQYPVKGMVVSVNRAASTFTASIEEIPGFMRAMTMPFEVRQSKELDGLAPGAMVEFTLVVD